MLNPVRLPSGIICDCEELQHFVLRTERMYPTFEPMTVEQLPEQVVHLEVLEHNIRRLYCSSFFVSSSVPF